MDLEALIAQLRQELADARRTEDDLWKKGVSVRFKYVENGRKILRLERTLEDLERTLAHRKERQDER